METSSRHIRSENDSIEVKINIMELSFCQNSTFFQTFLGDLLFLNETVESKIESHDWPREHRLEYKIQNHDDLLSFAQIDIVDSDVGRKIFMRKSMAWSIFFHFIGTARGAHQHSVKLLWDFSGEHEEASRVR